MEQNAERKSVSSNRRIGAQYARILFATIMAVGMGFVMSLLLTIIRVGFVPQLMPAWLSAFAIGTPVAIPISILIAPTAQRLARAAHRPKYTPLLVPAFMATAMSFGMSLVMTTVRIGFVANLIPIWLSSYPFILILAVPTAILVAPQAQRLVAYLTGAPGPQPPPENR